MARTKRKAEDVPVPSGVLTANEMLHRLGELHRDIALTEASQAETVAAAAKAADEATRPLRAEAARIERGVQIWAEANRAHLTDGGRFKTIRLASGTLSWRTSPPAVRLTKIEDVLAEVLRRGLLQFVRVKREINKEAMLQAPEIARTVSGVTIAGGEEFVIEAVVPKGAAA